MDTMEVVSVLSRWLHVAAGIIWIGHLYFYNFVNAQFSATLDGDTKKKVVPELMPRALYWFRWGAAYTWITGLLLLALVYYHGGIMFEADNLDGWGVPVYVMVAVALFSFGVYDQLVKSPLGKNLKVLGAVSFIFVAVVVYLMVSWGKFSFRAYNIHLGVMFGTIMAANVWMRIWPAQKKIIAAVKEGTAPDAGLVAMSGGRSRHNTYMSVPLIWTMINAHTTVTATNWWYLLVIVLLGWLSVAWVYKKAGTLKGF